MGGLGPAVTVFLVLLGVVLSGCATGQAAFKSGDYTEAARIAADRLARSPQAEKAAQVFLLSYPIARQEWLTKVEQEKNDGSNPFRWEAVAHGYGVLRDLANRAALTPFAGSDGIEVDYFTNEWADARERAASARELTGDGLLDTGSRFDAREAYRHYNIAMNYAGSRETLLEKRERARTVGTLIVGIDPVEVEGHGVNASLLETALIRELESQTANMFVRFVRGEDLGDLRADYFVSLSVGSLVLNRVDTEVGRTPYRREIIVGEGEGRVREVGAVLFRREKKITADSPARIYVYDREGVESVYETQLKSVSSWVAHWDVLEGDSRAVDGIELHLSEPADPDFTELAQMSVNGIVGDVHANLAGYFQNK